MTKADDMAEVRPGRPRSEKTKLISVQLNDQLKVLTNGQMNEKIEHWLTRWNGKWEEFNELLLGAAAEAGIILGRHVPARAISLQEFPYADAGSKRSIRIKMSTFRELLELGYQLGVNQTEVIRMAMSGDYTHPDDWRTGVVICLQQDARRAQKNSLYQARTEIDVLQLQSRGWARVGSVRDAKSPTYYKDEIKQLRAKIEKTFS